MHSPLVITHITLLLALALTQSPPETPAYVRRGDLTEENFRAYRNRLEDFHTALRAFVRTGAPPLLKELDDAPPQPVVWGYHILPKLVPDSSEAAITRFASRTYNWKVTDEYVAGEQEKLRRAIAELNRLEGLSRFDDSMPLEQLIREYRELVKNQKTIDQHIQYNRFWQRMIVMDRPRFDQLTAIYKLLMENPAAEAGRMIADVLGKPEVPAFLRILRPAPRQIVLRVPIYTDIQDSSYLTQIRAAIEQHWRAVDESTAYRVEIQFQHWRLENPPSPGEHIDLRTHAARFPMDGGVLTTGAETTHAFVGRYMALGPGDLSPRAIAHEFGHVLGFRDGYVRGYRDIGDEGIEIMELTSSFDDIMSSPMEGRVQASHFRLLLDHSPE
jgi:hypothetical protein